MFFMITFLIWMVRIQDFIEIEDFIRFIKQIRDTDKNWKKLLA